MEKKCKKVTPLRARHAVSQALGTDREETKGGGVMRTKEQKKREKSSGEESEDENEEG